MTPSKSENTASPGLHPKVPAPLRRVPLAALTLLVASGCTGMVAGGPGPHENSGGSGNGSASASGGPGAGGSASASAGNAGSAANVPLETGGVKLRLLTQAEYRASIQDLLGTVKAQLSLPDDTSVSGYISVGAAQISVGDMAAEQYETASLAATAEVFADAQRWQGIVGCQPKADLSDACVTTFIKSFGQRAFRRELDDAEVTQWVGVAQNGALLASSAAQGLATATSGLLESPNFLYRVETNKLDASNGRLKYDGLSMASRLSFLLKGGPPSADLLTAAAAGQLDTVDGVRAAATPLLTDASAADRMVAFFSEFAAIQQVLKVDKSTQLFPSYNAALQQSMFQGTQLFLKNIVLGASADVRSFYDSDQTFVDAALAPIYGVSPPASGFAQVTLAAEAARAGILGQASLIAGESQPDRNSPTRRGAFILQNLLCLTPPPPPPGVITTLPQDPNTTARQKMEQHRKNPSCAACHALFDPLGFGLEHFDAIGKYRTTDNGLPIDSTGTLDGVAFDGAAQLGAALRQNVRATSCMVRNFYRNANGRAEDDVDAAQIDSLVKDLASHGYIWRDLIADFVASDAFRSAPALPLMTASQ